MGNLTCKAAKRRSWQEQKKTVVLMETGIEEAELNLPSYTEWP